mmetsp:Transcript_10420/g.31635  ORF Transcript_10420/g.31635 Transcript_10420/m.31635 type:complete len:252 (-) Transcript_10420:296-1051(-)
MCCQQRRRCRRMPVERGRSYQQQHGCRRVPVEPSMHRQQRHGCRRLPVEPGVRCQQRRRCRRSRPCGSGVPAARVCANRRRHLPPSARLPPRSGAKAADRRPAGPGPRSGTGRAAGRRLRRGPAAAAGWRRRLGRQPLQHARGRKARRAPGAGPRHWAARSAQASGARLPRAAERGVGRPCLRPVQALCLRAQCWVPARSSMPVLPFVRAWRKEAPQEREARALEGRTEVAQRNRVSVARALGSLAGEARG